MFILRCISWQKSHSRVLAIGTVAQRLLDGGRKGGGTEMFIDQLPWLREPQFRQQLREKSFTILVLSSPAVVLPVR